jgi:hypothetical protein
MKEAVKEVAEYTVGRDARAWGLFDKLSRKIAG